MDEVGMESIKYELKIFRSNRKATRKILSMVSESDIFMGKHLLYCEPRIIHINDKNVNLSGKCWVCCENKNGTTESQILINSNKVEFYLCTNCKDKKMCHTCLRETSRCQRIHTRKLLTWQILLSQKFPKDIIRLITKKVK